MRIKIIKVLTTVEQQEADFNDFMLNPIAIKDISISNGNIYILYTEIEGQDE